MNRRDFIIGTASLSVASQSVSASDERQPSSEAQNDSEALLPPSDNYRACEDIRRELREINHGDKDNLGELRWLCHEPVHFHTKEDWYCLVPSESESLGDYKLEVEEGGHEYVRVKSYLWEDKEWKLQVSKF